MADADATVLFLVCSDPAILFLVCSHPAILFLVCSDPVFFSQVFHKIGDEYLKIAVSFILPLRWRHLSAWNAQRSKDKPIIFDFKNRAAKRPGYDCNRGHISSVLVPFLTGATWLELSSQHHRACHCFNRQPPTSNKHDSTRHWPQQALYSDDVKQPGARSTTSYTSGARQEFSIWVGADWSECSNPHSLKAEAEWDFLATALLERD